MKLKPILLVTLFLGIWFILRNYKTWYNDFQSSTQSQEGEIVNNKKQGEWKVYYQNGNLKTIENFKNDTLNGSYISYHSNGKIRSRSVYKMGIQVDSVFMYHSNGRINLAEWKDKNGKGQGTFKIYHENGQLSQVAKYMDGHLHDTSKAY